jgi:hypothetical protein
LTAKAIKNRSSTSVQIKLHEERRLLQKKLKAFQEMGSQFLQGFENNISLPRTEKEKAADDIDDYFNELEEDVDMGEGSDDGDGDDDDEGNDEDDDGILEPESTEIPFPSSIGHDTWIKQGLSKLLIKQELQLREGQANESLENIRISLGNKALLLRTRHHGEKEQAHETRSWAAIHRESGVLQRHVRTYCRAYTAMNCLGSVKHYQPITKKDLAVNADITEENRFGQKNFKLAWFWRVGGNLPDQPASSWMEECECPFHLFHLTLPFIACTSVWRVSWLRAKARQERWMEEYITVRGEMGNTIRYYEEMMEQWEKRAQASENDQLPGHSSYAHRQANMWKSLMIEAASVCGDDAD